MNFITSKQARTLTITFWVTSVTAVMQIVIASGMRLKGMEVVRQREQIVVLERRVVALEQRMRDRNNRLQNTRQPSQ